MAGALKSVDISVAGGALQASAPKELFRLPEGTRDRYAMSPDGQRFVTMLGPTRRPTDTLSVVLDWLDELKQLAPQSRPQ